MADNISDLEAEVEKLSIDLDKKKAKLLQLKGEIHSVPKLDNSAISRYSRQLILPEIGPRGQERILKAKVLIVGAGGLGCPSCLYLCAAGVGHIGLVDFDSVEISNIQRQVMHTETRVGVGKSLSCALSGSDLNSKTKFDIHNFALNSHNALETLQPYDIVIDCSDNVATRYLLNDACVISKKPLVSGSALRFEGQLTIYNYREGPCYRCLYPKPPPVETVTNCSDGGVLGAVTGVIGSLQALETVKVICDLPDTMNQRMLLFDGLTTTFRNVKLRGKKKDCVVCGQDPEIRELIDYVEFCGGGAHDKSQNLSILDPQERISVKEYEEILNSRQEHYLIDVRLPVENEICKIPFENQRNIPIDEFSEWNLDKVKEKVQHFVTDRSPLFVICHRGNDSQKVVRFLKDNDCGPRNVRDIRGGLEAWSRQIDLNFPRY